MKRDSADFGAVRVRNLTHRIELAKLTLRDRGNIVTTWSKGEPMARRIELDEITRENWLKRFPELRNRFYVETLS